MSNWLPVIGTLAGVIVTGVISFALQWQSNQHAQNELNTKLSDERTKWAVEFELERIQKFYLTIESLIDAAVDFRIQQAWKNDERAPPPWVLSYNDARGGIENAIGNANSEALLLDKKLKSEFVAALSKYNDWFMAEKNNDGVRALQQLEQDLLNYKENLAEEYRRIFDLRRHGEDL